MQSVAELLPQIYRNLAREATDEEALVLALWPVVVGKELAERTRAVRLFGTTLIVETPSQAWRKELAKMESAIVGLMNQAAAKPMIKGVEFRVAVKVPLRPPARASSAAGAKRDEAESISDPHLRRLYRLSRQRAKSKESE
jgi:predicted nucleic acid-binding Zn ribbon protein